MADRVPIGDYGLIGDTRSAALVSPDGSIDWWCVPRFDDPPLFGRLVGGDEAGWFSIRPADEALAAARAYRPDSVTLTTTWTIEGAELELADGLVGEVEGRFLPGTVLVRRLTARGRAVRAQLHLAPRFGYDRQVARRIARRASALVCEHGDLAIAVTSDGPTIEADRPVDFEVRPGEPVTIALTAARRSPLIVVPPAVAAAELTRDEAGWRTWAAGIDVAHHREAVVRSLITLQLLTYSPSGAPVAAPTTSLPERIGGDRNWDYRYAWPRDASIGIAAFLAAGKPQEARAFLAWLLHASRLSRPRLPVLFTLDGRPGPPEAELPGWPGYAASRPVRVGNGAARQHQLDGYGWVLDAAWLLTDAGHRLYGETWRAVAALADQVAATWTEPDAGIWEKRTKPAHHVHSKLMAWLALDRALRIASARGDRRRRRQQRWTNARDAARRRHPRPWVRPRPDRLHRHLRLRRTRRRRVDAAGGRLRTGGAAHASPAPSTPSAVSSAPAGHCCTATRPAPTASPAAKAPSCPARSGSSTPSPAPAAPMKPTPCSTSCSSSAVRSASTAKRSTPPPANTSATTLKPSPTPPSSKPRCP